MVMLESLAGTGHKLVKLRPKLGDKMETIAFDPYGEWQWQQESDIVFQQHSSHFFKWKMYLCQDRNYILLISLVGGTRFVLCGCFLTMLVVYAVVFCCWVLFWGGFGGRGTKTPKTQSLWCVTSDDCFWQDTQFTSNNQLLQVLKLHHYDSLLFADYIKLTVSVFVDSFHLIKCYLC